MMEEYKGFNLKRSEEDGIEDIEFRDSFSSFTLSRYSGLHACMSSVLLSNVFVREEYRKNGRGNNILETAYSFAKNENATTLQLYAECCSWQESWYRRNGFAGRCKQVLDGVVSVHMYKAIK
jgi:predicted GNAT family N-acyltransferase